MQTGIGEKTCGRPTKSGAPCKARFSGAGFACKLHTTSEEAAQVTAYELGYRHGWERHSEISQSMASANVEHLKRRIADLESQLDKTKRQHTVNGCQAVEVNGYGYLWRGTPALEVGDQVMLPENPVSRIKEGPGSWQGTVTALGTTYEGSLSMILRRVSQAASNS